MAFKTIKKLGEVCKISSGGSAPQGKKYFQNGKYPFFRTSDVGAVHLSDGFCCVRDYLNDDGAKKLKLFKKGTILFPKSGASTFLNHRVVMGCDGYVSSHLATITTNEKVDYKYLYFFLIIIDAKSIAPSSSYPSLKISDLAEILIPLPPLEIQRKIVERIEKLMAKIDEAKKLRKEAMADASALIPSALNKIFEEGKNKGWKEKNLEEVVEQKTSKNIKDNIPYIGMEDIESNSGRFLGNLKPKSVKSLTSYFDDSCVLYGKLRPYLNKVYIPNFEGHCSTEFIPLKPNMNYLIREWLTYWIMSPDIVKKIMFTTTGARMPRANMKRVIVFKIPLPPLPEQRKIVKYLDSLVEKVRKIQAVQSETEKELKLLEKSVLNKAFDVKS